MPLPLPLLGAVLALSGGVAVVLRRRGRRDEDDADPPGDPVPYRLAFLRHRLAGHLRALGDRKLLLWEHVLADFAQQRPRIRGLSGREAALNLSASLPAPRPDDLARIAQIAEVLARWRQEGTGEAQWEDHLDPLDLADIAARGVHPGHAHARDGASDCASLAWLLAPLPAEDATLFGGLRLSAAAQQQIRSPADADEIAPGAKTEAELRALLAVLTRLEVVVEEVLVVLDHLHVRAAAMLGALAVGLHINDDYDRMADLPLPGERHSGRALVEQSHHLAALLLALLDAPLLDTEGRPSPAILPLLEAHEALQARYGYG